LNRWGNKSSAVFIFIDIMENTQLKDLEVLSKYLSEEELKEVATQVARETF